MKTATVFLDIEKTFDRVWHEVLLHKLNLFGIPIQLIKLTMSFLYKRTFQVKVDGNLSSEKPAHVDVPQGSCLSPFLYLVYTNDILLLHSRQYRCLSTTPCSIQVIIMLGK